MVKLDIIRKSDARLGDFAKFTPVALFVGATNGVGRNSTKHFEKSTIGSRPRAYFVGRSRERGEQLKSELTAINSDGYKYAKVTREPATQASRPPKRAGHLSRK
ncbi:hypothetical protein ZTR_11304 [Talaromyces verruculosus]|nr:hypothetical protein ZTR_11304 [Talaromyces verruculosus]